MLKVAYYSIYKGWLNDGMFDLKSSSNLNNVFERYVALKDYLYKNNVEIHTYDYYKNYKEVDLWIVSDPEPSFFIFMIKNLISPKKVIPIMNEPPIINVWGWRFIKLYSLFFPTILTWNSELCLKNKKFFHYHFPVKIDLSKYQEYFSIPKKNLCLIMHSDKYSRRKGELYSLRREIISYFEKRGDNLLDLYGRGWNSQKNSDFKTTIHRGTTEDKWQTYAEHYFSFCIDNSVVPGYITYDPIISMSVGTVPIYLPMPDSTKFIPENTFIDFSKFKNMDDLTKYLLSIAHTPKYEEYRKNGLEFLSSEKFRPFTLEKYCEDIYLAIKNSSKK